MKKWKFEFLKCWTYEILKFVFFNIWKLKWCCAFVVQCVVCFWNFELVTQTNNNKSNVENLKFWQFEIVLVLFQQQMKIRRTRNNKQIKTINVFFLKFWKFKNLTCWNSEKMNLWNCEILKTNWTVEILRF